MNVIKPKAISLTSSDVAEADAAAYVAGTTYAIDALVMYEHRVYKSLKNSNTGNTPDVSPTYWSDQGATNPWKMFDNLVNSQTIAAGTSMTVVVDFSSCTGFSLFMLDANEVTATVKDSGGTTVWTETIDLADQQILADWYEYFFTAIVPVADITRTGLPVYGVSSLTLVITRSSGQVKCGHCSIGAVYPVGDTEWGAEVGITSYGRKDVDAFGQAYLAPGRYAKRVVLTAYVTKAQVDVINKRLAGLREVPCTWICDNTDTGMESLTVFGFYKNYAIEIDGPVMSALSLEIEGMV